MINLKILTIDEMIIIKYSQCLIEKIDLTVKENRAYRIRDQMKIQVIKEVSQILKDLTRRLFSI